MPQATLLNPMTPLTELLSELEVEVNRGNRVRALDLVRQIQQQLVQENNEQANIERCVRELMAKLERPVAGAHVRSPASITSERSGSEAADDDVVYPVWFGTNRKPN